jgi:peptide/nickel transport system substrate-binding protein
VKQFSKLGCTIVVVLVVSLLAACGPQPTPAPTAAPAQVTEVQPTQPPPPTEPPPAAPKILKVRITSDMMDLDPAFIPQNVDSNISSNIHQGLIVYPGVLTEVEEILLAEPFAVSDDGLTISFKLREGIQFHKGYGELTAEDVKYSYERFQDPDLDPPYRDDWAALDRVEVTGKYSGDIILTEPFAPLWKSTLPVTAGWVVSKAAMEEMGHDGYATNPIGTGPYEFVEWIPNQKVVLKRFADYWGEPGEWDEIHFLVITENSAAEIALESGELDFGQVGTDAVERFEASANFDVYAVDTLSYGWIAMNVQHPNLQDVNVRRAIRAGIDVNSLIEAAYDGKYERACSMIAPSLLGAWTDAPCYERDVEQAKAYLAEAGLEGLDVTLTFENVLEGAIIAEIMQANLAEVGINVELIPQEGGLFWEEGYGLEGAQVRQLAIMQYATNPDPAWVTVWFTCAQVEEWNWMYWCDEEYDRLHNEGMVEIDPVKRAEIYVQMQKIMDEAAHSVWIAYPTVFFVAKNTITPVVMATGEYIPWRFKSR